MPGFFLLEAGMQLQCGDRWLDLSRPNLMAVLNVTPDSFYDGGALFEAGKLEAERIHKKLEALINAGADIIDVGGESTRPGAQSVPLQEELDRVLPVVEWVSSRFDVVISVDTSSAQVMREAAQAGAGMLNDVRALTRGDALEAAVETRLPVCLMHMQGEPGSMQDRPCYSDAFEEVATFLRQRLDKCVAAGIDRRKIVVDPGIGFGKTDEHNLLLLRKLDQLASIAPVLLGVSRKSMFGRLLDRPLSERLAGSLAVALMACQQGVSILRVHDVAETRDVVKMWQLVNP